MEHDGIDVHASESQICTLTEQGEVLEQRIRTRADRFAETLGRRPRARILIEASTESEWVARCLEGIGHEVIVADPNYAPLYATRSRRVKTDRRDAQALMDACRLGAYRPAHRTSDAQRQVRAALAVRDALVRTRARFIRLIRALLRRQGLRVRSGTARAFPQRLATLTVPEPLSAEIAPLLAVMETLNPQLDAADARLTQHAAADPVVRRLETVPNIGPVTALSFVATLDQVERFRGPHPAAADLGLVPGERSSGEPQRRGPITQRGHGRTRWRLVEAAWGMVRHAQPHTAELRAWAARIAARRGRRIAAVVWFSFQYYSIVLEEEQYLAQRFGEAYAHYRKHVRRCIPRLTRYRGVASPQPTLDLRVGLASERRTLQGIAAVVLFVVVRYVVGGWKS